MRARRLALAPFLRDERGATALEFALVSTAFLSLVIGICYVAIMLFNNMGLEWALTKAARVAEINKAATQNDITTALNGYLAGMNLPNATVTYSSSVGSNGVRTANIGASYTQTYAVPMVHSFTINFSSAIVVPQPS